MIPWWPIYESSAFLVAASLAIVAGSAVARGRRASSSWPAWSVVVAVFGAYLLLGVPAAVPGRAVAGVIPTPQGVVELLAGAALVLEAARHHRGAGRLVPGAARAALPARARRRDLRGDDRAAQPPARGRRSSRRRCCCSSASPSAWCTPRSPCGPGLAFLITSVAWLVRVAIANRRAISAGRPADAALADARRVLGASALVAVALVGATAASVALPVPPQDRRPRRAAAAVRAARAGRARSRGSGRRSHAEVRDEPMLVVRGLPAGAGIRIATLDTYDGIVYSVGGGDGTAESGRFTRVPYRLDQSDVIGEETRLEVEVRRVCRRVGARRRAARAHLVRRPACRAARRRLLLQRRDGHRRRAGGPPVRAMRTPRTRWRRSNPRASRCCGPAPACCRPPPNCPTGSSQLLDEWAPASDDRGVRLQKMLAGLQSAGYVSHGLEEEPPSRSGHAIDRLEELATERPMIGDGEQYAVAAALMARRDRLPRARRRRVPARPRRPAARRRRADARSTAATCRRGSRCRRRMARGCRSIRTPSCARSPSASPTSPRSSRARSPRCRRPRSGRPWTTSTRIPTSPSTSATTARSRGSPPCSGR